MGTEVEMLRSWFEYIAKAREGCLKTLERLDPVLSIRT